MAKLSAELNSEAPACMVIVCLPALIKSAFTEASSGKGPMPNNPFSD
jgi:hypothetical protein